MLKNPHKQKGIVIIMALFIVALIATMSYVMMSRFSRDMVRSGFILNNTQGEYYAQGSIDWAIDQLKNNLLRKKKGQLVDEMPIISPVDEVDGFAIQSSIYDLQGRININNINSFSSSSFKYLLKILFPKMSIEEQTNLVLAITDWVSKNAAASRDFARYYSEQNPPYLAPHREMVHPSELLLVKGMTKEIYEKILPYICTLKSGVKVNLNSATPVVLKASLKDYKINTDDQLREFMREIKKKPPQSLEELAGTNAFKDKIDLDPTKAGQFQFDFVSQYFLVETKVKKENQSVILYTVLERTIESIKGRGKKVIINILSQSKGMY